jgi:hypothetical protein
MESAEFNTRRGAKNHTMQPIATVTARSKKTKAAREIERPENGHKLFGAVSWIFLPEL